MANVEEDQVWMRAMSATAVARRKAEEAAHEALIQRRIDTGACIECGHTPGPRLGYGEHCAACNAFGGIFTWALPADAPVEAEH
jgi:uncharacterized OB-fold protein